MTDTWLPPAGPAVRGTVIVLPGRGEHSGVYERFGRRLASDAYLVHGLDVGLGDDVETVRGLVAAAAADATGPVVLAGSDTGALHALAVASSGLPGIDALLLAGLPAAGSDAPAADDDWEHELVARTTCPTHRSRIAADEGFVRGELGRAVLPALAAALEADALAKLDLPVLIVHGESDAISPLSSVAAVADQLVQAEFAVVRTSAHDVLNDATHRTVAAQVVQWLERLRDDPALWPIIELVPARQPAGTG